MTALQASAILLTLTSSLFLSNERILRLPTSIGLITLSLSAASVLATLQFMGMAFVGTVTDRMLAAINLDDAMLNGMLCLLLFVDAIHVDFKQLWRQ